MLLTAAQIRELLRRLAWKPVYEDRGVVLCRVLPGYSDDKEIAKIQASLSIMLGVESRRGRQAEPPRRPPTRAPSDD